jgi:hypothetical protein
MKFGKFVMKAFTIVVSDGFSYMEQALKDKLPLCHVVPCFIETCSKA